MQTLLERIRLTIRSAAPGAQEAISYRIPAFTQRGVLVYFAAFKNHIGLYPPVSGDAALEKAISPYAGKKGNLRFPLNEPIPYDLIERIVKLRVRQNLAKAAAKSGKKLFKPNSPHKRPHGVARRTLEKELKETDR